MEWTKEMILKLITELESARVVWDMQHPAYRDRRAKQAAWDHLAEVTSTSIEEVQRKVNVLRTQWKREDAKVKNSTRPENGFRPIYTSKWFGYERLKFLQNSKPASIKNHMVPPRDEQEEHGVLYEQNEAYPYESKADVEYVTVATGIPTHYVPQRHLYPTVNPQRTPTPEDIVIEPCTSTKEPKSMHKEPVGHTDNTTPDEYSVFGMHVANELRSIKCDYALKVAKLKINQILFEACTGAFDSPQVTISDYRHISTT